MMRPTASSPEGRGLRSSGVWRVEAKALVFCLCLGILVFGLLRRPALSFDIELASSSDSETKLFYDRGSGYNEQDSVSLSVTNYLVSPFQDLNYSLPQYNIRSLRFDPLTMPGTSSIRRASIRGTFFDLKTIPFSDIKPFNQIQSLSIAENRLKLTTTPGSNDSGVSIDLHGGLSYEHLRRIDNLEFISLLEVVAVIGGFLAFYGSAAIRRLRLSRPYSIAMVRLEILARRISVDGFIQFDRLAVLFYCACIATAIIATLADLNGSSIGALPPYGHGFASDPLAGSPREIRSDEFAFHSPVILYQALRNHPFAYDQSVLGNHGMALLANVPVAHVSTIFRPQFWGFFFLPITYAYSFYWQCKSLLLLAGVFTWLLLVCRSSALSILGSLWFFFSPLTQWQYSWASLLPEMIGLCCLTVVFACLLCVARTWTVAILAGLAMALCAVDFMLCCYVPHLLPLIIVGISFVFAWISASRQRIFNGTFASQRIIVLCVSAAIVGLAGISVYLSAHQAIAAMSHTVYPGSRRFGSGSFPLTNFISHFFGWVESERHSSELVGNICEAAGFLWLAPFTLLQMSKTRLSTEARTLLCGVWLPLLILLAWVTLPMPNVFGSVFGLAFTGYSRVVPALGLLNTAIVCLVLSSIPAVKREQQTDLIEESQNLVLLITCFLAFYLLLSTTNAALQHFFTPAEVALCSLLNALLIQAMLQVRKAALFTMLILPGAALFGLVNPVQQGLNPITSSTFFRYVDKHPALRQGRWLVYSGSIEPSGFIEAAGCQVYSGLKMLPDVDHFPQYAAAGLSPDAFNRSGYFLVAPLPINARTTAVAPLPHAVVWSVSPKDPLLPALGIKYIVFEKKPSPDVIGDLRPLNDLPIDDFWIYETSSNSSTAAAGAESR